METLNTNNWTMTTGTTTTGCYEYWFNQCYPPTTTTVYTWPIYQDKGKQAFEIVKRLQAIKAVNLKTADQFVSLMEEVLKVL